MRKITVALFPILAVLVVLFLPPSRNAVADIDTGVYTEDFTTYDHSDYINQTAWDVFSRQLRLRRTSGVDVCSYAGCFSAMAWKDEDSFYVVWADLRSSDYAIYAQRLDNHGNRLWPADVRVSSGSGLTADIAVDADGNAVVVWGDALGYTKLQRVSPTGILLLQEKQLASGSADRPLIRPAGDGVTFWAIWRTINQSTLGFTAAHIDRDGNAILTRQINDDPLQGNHAGGYAMTVDSYETMWAAWYHSPDGVNTEIHLQAINLDGSLKWDHDQTFVSGDYPALSPAPGGGVYLKWSQYGIGDRLQRLQPDGSKAWAQDLQIWLADYTSFDTDSQGNLWASSSNGQDIAVQKVSPEGSLLFSSPIWIRSTHESYGQIPTIRVNSQRIAAVTFIDNRNTVSEIRLQMLSEQGALAWPTEKLFVDDLGSAIQNSPAVKVAQDGTSYLAWKDSRQGQAQIYVQSLASDGSRRWGSDLIVTTLSSNFRISRPKVILLDQDQTVLVAWYAGAGQYDYDGALFIQKFDTNGNRLWPTELRLLDTDFMGEGDIPAIATNEDGGFTVAWATAFTVHVQRFDADGNPVWPTDVTASGDGSTLNQYLDISIAPDGSTAVMFFKNEGTMNGGAIYVLRLNSAGQPSWPTPILVNWQSGGPSFSLAMDNGGNAIISWVVSYKTWSQKYSPTGERLWNNGTAIEIGDTLLSAALVSIAPGDRPTYVGFNLAYIGDPASVLFVRQFESSGELVWNQQFAAIQTGLLVPKMAADMGFNGDVLAVWEDTRYGNQDLLALKLYADGSLAWPDPLQIVNPDSFYSLHGMARSNTVDVLDGRILEANLTADYDLNGGSLVFYLSNDGETTWEEVAPGINHRFTSHGSDLRWGVDMTADPLWPRGPVIRSVQINYSALPPGADDYEPDDVCSQAQPIETAGVSQLHTFHVAADEDWVQFDAKAGQIYVIQANNVAENADPALELYDVCGGNQLAVADNLDGGDVRLNWTAPISSSVYLRVQNTFGVTATVLNGYELSVRAFDPSPIVVIVAGKADTLEQQSAIDNSADLAYRTFLNAGVVKTHLRYFSPSGSRDVDGDGNADDITGTPHPDVIRDSIQDWARLQGTALGIPFYLVLIGPGDTDVFYAWGTGESISATELNLWLANLEATSGTDAINVVVESPKSGSFIDVTDLGSATISGHTRVLLTSTSSTLDSYLASGGAYFTNALFNALGQEMNLHAAFEEAVAVIQAAGVDQQPWLDDDGDALPENIVTVPSALAISALSFKTEGLLSSDRGLCTSRSMAPEIRQVEKQPISQMAVRIRVQATDDGSISQVTAEAHPCEPATPLGTFPVIHFVVNPLLADSGQPGWFVADVDSVNVCWYALYAIDDEGNRSAPSVLMLQSKIYLPLINR